MLKAVFAWPLHLKLCGGQHRFAHGRWKLNERKVVRWEKIIFSGLVNDAKLSVFGCVEIGQNLIDLSRFERYLVPLILKADYK
jgi:hypothetical protein